MGEQIKFVNDRSKRPTNGSAGLQTQLPGCATTVSAIASATGGIASGNLISTDK